MAIAIARTVLVHTTRVLRELPRTAASLPRSASRSRPPKRHPEYLIQCWHSDRHGCFSDARCRILTCALDGNRRICRFTEDGLRADSLLARELLQFHDVAAIPDIPALDKGSGILTLDITALDPIDTSSYDTSTSPLFRSAMMK